MRTLSPPPPRNNIFHQGYETGRLIAVTPFVAKILEGAPSGKSRVFKPPNPWIMGLFSALHEVGCCGAGRLFVLFVQLFILLVCR